MFGGKTGDLWTLDDLECQPIEKAIARIWTL